MTDSGSVLLGVPSWQGDYWAEWNSTSLLIVTFGVVDPNSAPVVGQFTVSCQPGNDIIAAASRSEECASTSPPLVGSWGYTAPTLVSIRSFVADDPDDADEVCSAGDQLTITFSGPTDIGRLGTAGPLFAGSLGATGLDGGIGGGGSGGGGGGGSMGFGEPLLSGGALDELLELSPKPIGANLTAEWRDAATLVLTIASPGTPPPQLGQLRVSVRHAAALRDAARSSVRTTATSLPLAGDCGRPPQPVGFTAADDDDADAVCSTGDVLTLIFDRPTDRPPVDSRLALDRLLTFSQVRVRGEGGG